MKDWFLSTFGEWLIGKHISQYGKMTSFHIDTHNKRVVLSAELRGESSPIEIEASYERHEDGGNQSIKITGIKSSREWMNDLANTLLQQYPQVYPIPHGLVGVATRILNI